MKFPYIKWPDPKDPNSCHLPLLLVRIEREGVFTPPFLALVDSGADMSTFPYDVAAFFGIDPRAGRMNHTQGVSGVTPTFVHDGFQIEIDTHLVDTKIAFVHGVPFGILGREGVFERFRVIFNERKRFVELQPY